MSPFFEDTRPLRGAHPYPKAPSPRTITSRPWPVTVHPVCSNQTPQTGWLINNGIDYSQGWESEVRLPRLSGEGCHPGHFLPCPHMVGKLGHLGWGGGGLSHEDSSPIHEGSTLPRGLHPPTIAPLPKAHLLTSPCWVLGSQHTNLEGGGGGVSLQRPDITRAEHDTCCRDSQGRDPKPRGLTKSP